MMKGKNSTDRELEQWDKPTEVQPTDEQEDEWTEADFLTEESSETTEPSAHRIWMKRVVIAIVALALVGNAFAVIPLIFNLNVIQFLKKTRELSQNETLQAYKQAIVIVEAGDRKGTGFNIDPQGMIITNAHVVGDAPQAVVGFENGQTFHANVAASDDKLDLAVLKLAESPSVQPLPTLEIETSPQYTEGANIYYIGNPYFFHHIIGEGSIRRMTNVADRDSPVLAIDAPIYKGNSGSPVLNEDGKVIAVIYATARIADGNDRIKVGLAVPILDLEHVR